MSDDNNSKEAMETREEMEARHRKELKAVDGERRAAVKKAKSTKGKKAKDEVALLEADFDRRLDQVKERHAHELLRAQQQQQQPLGDGYTEEESTAAAIPSENGFDPHESESVNEVSQQLAPSHNGVEQDAASVLDERHRKNEKARKKREKARERERERERLIEEELANAGPSARDVENEMIEKQLAPLQLRIREVAADGHCLYRAVAASAHYDNMNGASDYRDMRNKCADVLAAHEDDFSPFCELSDDVPNYDAYVERVRASAEWGGHLELRALSIALKRPVVVYSAQSVEPLRIDEESGNGGDDDDDGSGGGRDPIRLSYHRSYYALGEHYNQVVPVDEVADA